jgi:hypothetical protein
VTINLPRVDPASPVDVAGDINALAAAIEAALNAGGGGTPTVPGALWVSLDEARREWADAPLDDDRLTFILTASQERCEAYLGALVDTTTGLPVRWKVALILDARDLWGTEYAVMDTMGMTGTTVTLPAMTRKVKTLLRPHRGIVVG